MKAIRNGIVIIALAFVLPTTTVAGVYADDMARCLVDSTSKNDRLDLVRWLFSAAAAHPAVAPISSVSDEQMDASNKVVADLFMELLINSCFAETKRALQYEGNSTMESAFAVLGEVAGKELFSSPEVAAVISGLNKYVDLEKLESLVESE